MDESKFQEPESLVFGTDKGTPLDEKNLMRRVIKPVVTKLGMPWVGWNTFRHAHSTLAEELQMALSDRQAQMGHSEPNDPALYAFGSGTETKGLDVMANRPTGTDSNLTLTCLEDGLQVVDSIGRGGAI